MQEKCGLLSREAFSVGSLHIFAIIAVPCTKNIYGFEFDDCKIQERRGVNSSNNDGRFMKGSEINRRTMGKLWTIVKCDGEDS